MACVIGQGKRVGPAIDPGDAAVQMQGFARQSGGHGLYHRGGTAHDPCHAILARQGRADRFRVIAFDHGMAIVGLREGGQTQPVEPSCRDRLMRWPDPCRSKIGQRHPIRAAQGVDAPADAIRRLEQGDAGALVHKAAGAGQPGEACADDGDIGGLHDGWAFSTAGDASGRTCALLYKNFT